MSPAHPAATNAIPESFAPARPRRRRAILIVAALASLSVYRPGGGVGAATIPTGTTPKDTAVRTDGLVSYVLNTGNSTLTVVSVPTATVLSTISLGQPPNTCADIDWHPGLSRVLVGCTNGNILDVDPVTGTVLVNATNGACNST